MRTRDQPASCGVCALVARAMAILNQSDIVTSVCVFILCGLRADSCVSVSVSSMGWISLNLLIDLELSVCLQ